MGGFAVLLFSAGRSMFRHNGAMTAFRAFRSFNAGAVFLFAVAADALGKQGAIV